MSIGIFKNCFNFTNAQIDQNIEEEVSTLKIQQKLKLVTDDTVMFFRAVVKQVQIKPPKFPAT